MFYHSVLLDPILKVVSENPDKILLTANGKEVSALDLLNRSKALAVGMQKQGVQKDDVVLLAIQPGLEFLEIMYAAILLRCKVAIIDPEMGRDNYSIKLQKLDPKWAFVDTKLLFLEEQFLLRKVVYLFRKNIPHFPIRSNIRIIATGSRMPLLRKYLSFKSLSAEDSAIELQAVPDNHKFLIVYTSGTLGEPKGVFHSFQSLNSTLQRLGGLMKEEKNCNIASYLPHFMLLGISIGMPVYIYNVGWSAKKKLEFFKKNRIGTMFGPPSDLLPLIHHCKRTKQRLPESFQHILLGSAPIHASFLNKLFAVLHSATKVTCLYGMTEHLMIAHVDGRYKANYVGNGDLVGTLFEGVELDFEDGEIKVKSDQLFEHYFHETTRGEFHYSGDYGTLDEDKLLLLTGRKKDMIIRRSTNIYPALYEPTIKNIPGVEEAAMIGIWNVEKEDEEVYLFIESSKKMKAGSIMKKLSHGTYSIDSEACPDRIIFSKIPVMGRQKKIDRKKLRELYKI